MSEKQFKPTRGSGKSLLQTAILLHETREFNKLSVEEIYSILMTGYNEQKDVNTNSAAKQNQPPFSDCFFV